MRPEYRTLGGRVLDLSGLSDEDEAVIAEMEIMAACEAPWDVFERARLEEQARRGWKIGSTAYLVAQDLGFRLAIAQGKVAPPDYRDQLRELVEERYPSLRDCAEGIGLLRGDLALVLCGSTQLHRLLAALGVRLVVEWRAIG